VFKDEKVPAPGVTQRGAREMVIPASLSPGAEGEQLGVTESTWGENQRKRKIAHDLAETYANAGTEYLSSRRDCRRKKRPVKKKRQKPGVRVFCRSTKGSWCQGRGRRRYEQCGRRGPWKNVCFQKHRPTGLAFTSNEFLRSKRIRRTGS